MQSEEETPLPFEVVAVMGIYRTAVLYSIDEIDSVWPSLTAQEFNPVPTSLSLLDSTSEARDFTSFCKVRVLFLIIDI
jgi:hypothetical protein